MKKRVIKRILVFVMTIAYIGVLSQQTKAMETVTIREQFPDVKLQEKVMETLMATADENIEVTRFYGITNLDYSSSEIESIEGIDIFKDLTNLDLFNNQISVLPASVWSLEKLFVFNTWGNAITDIPKEQEGKWSSILRGQILPHAQKEIVNKSFEINMPQLMKYINSNNPNRDWSSIKTSLFVYTGERNEWGDPIRNHIKYIDAITYDFEKGVIIIPEDTIDTIGNYTLVVDSDGFDIGYNIAIVNEDKNNPSTTTEIASKIEKKLSPSVTGVKTGDNTSIESYVLMLLLSGVYIMIRKIRKT